MKVKRREGRIKEKLYLSRLRIKYKYYLLRNDSLLDLELYLLFDIRFKDLSIRTVNYRDIILIY